MYVQTTWIQEKIPRIPISVSYIYIYFHVQENTTIAFNLIHMRQDILQKRPPHSRHKLLTPCKNLHMKILPHTHIHKILPKQHCTPLHTRKNLHTKILTLAHLNKRLTNAHHTPLNPHTFIRTPLFKRQSFTCTKNILS